MAADAAKLYEEGKKLADNKYPAVFIGTVRRRWSKGDYTYLAYRYRGEEYIVEKCNNGCFGAEPVWSQHKRYQAEIDAKLDEPEQEPAEWKYEGSAQEGFDLFWSQVEGNEVAT